MANEKPIELITPPNMLKAKVGGPIAMMDEDAVKRAEEALRELSVNFQAWLDDEVHGLEVAYIALSKATDKPAALATVFEKGHDLKGLGTTYGYPLITRLAGSLCKMLETEPLRRRAPLSLVDAHVNGIRAALRGKVQTEDHPVGRALATELDRQVDDFKLSVEGEA